MPRFAASLCCINISKLARLFRKNPAIFVLKNRLQNKHYQKVGHFIDLAIVSLF